MRHIFGITGSLIVAAALAVSGCATETVAPPSQELRSEIKFLGLVSPERKTLASPDEPVKGSANAALTGAGQGAAGTFVGTAHGFCQVGGPYGCALGVVLGAVLAPVGAVVGAGVGASKSHSKEEVETAQKTIVGVTSAARPNEELVSRFSKHAATTHETNIVSVECEGARERCVVRGNRKPKYALRLQYLRFVLDASGRISPDLSVAATVDAQIFSLASGKSVYERQWRYESEKTPYFYLAKDGGRALEKLFEMSHETIAIAVAGELFAANVPGPKGPIKIPKAGVNRLPSSAIQRSPSLYDLLKERARKEKQEVDSNGIQ